VVLCGARVETTPAGGRRHADRPACHVADGCRRMCCS
jgi:hypothetical protein